MKLLGCVVVLAAMASPAAADDDEATVLKRLVAAQVDAISKHDAKAFAATFDDDGFVFLPGAREEGAETKGIETAAKSWLARLGSATVKLDQAHYGLDWFDGELALSSGGRLRYTAVVRAFIDNGSIAWKIGAVHISEGVDDKTVLAAASTGKLPPLPKIAGKFRDDKPEAIATFADRIMDHAAVAVVGSAPTEHAVGRAAAGKLLASWRSLELRSLDGETRGADPNNMLLTTTVAHVVATMRVGGKTVKVPYRVLMVTQQPWATAAEHGAKSELLVAHFSVATQ